jgi:hypothetical protein
VTFWVQDEETWRTASAWPPPARDETTFPGDGARLAASAQNARPEYRCVADVGAQAGLWYPMALEIGSFDQAKDDARSLCFTSDPLADDLLVVGAPRATLRVALPEREAVRLAVKVCDVDPDGRSTLVTSGWLHLDAGDAREATVEVELYPTAYRLKAGNRVRWTVAGSDFPRIWPTATEPTIAVVSSTDAPSTFVLPVAAEDLPAFDAPVPTASPDRAGPVVKADPICRFERDEAARRSSVTVGVGVTVALDQGGSFSLENSLTASITSGAPMSANVKTAATVTVELASGETVRADAVGISTEGRRHIAGTLSSDGQKIYERYWTSLSV